MISIWIAGAICGMLYCIMGLSMIYSTAYFTGYLWKKSNPEMTPPFKFTKMLFLAIALWPLVILYIVAEGRKP